MPQRDQRDPPRQGRPPHGHDPGGSAAAVAIGNAMPVATRPPISAASTAPGRSESSTNQPLTPRGRRRIVRRATRGRNSEYAGRERQDMGEGEQRGRGNTHATRPVGGGRGPPVRRGRPRPQAAGTRWDRGRRAMRRDKSDHRGRCDQQARRVRHRKLITAGHAASPATTSIVATSWADCARRRSSARPGCSRRTARGSGWRSPACSARTG